MSDIPQARCFIKSALQRAAERNDERDIHDLQTALALMWKKPKQTHDAASATPEKAEDQ